MQICIFEELENDTQTTCKIQTRNVLDLHVQNNTFIKGNGGEGK